MKSMMTLVSVLLVSLSTFAATTKSKTSKGATGKKAVPLGTSFRFDGSSINGKLPTSASTTATVENDKFLEDLLSARKDFSDREAKDLERQ